MTTTFPPRIIAQFNVIYDLAVAHDFGSSDPIEVEIKVAEDAHYLYKSVPWRHWDHSKVTSHQEEKCTHGISVNQKDGIQLGYTGDKLRESNVFWGEKPSLWAIAMCHFPKVYMGTHSKEKLWIFKGNFNIMEICMKTPYSYSMNFKIMIQSFWSR